jgi:hypothetical protein
MRMLHPAEECRALAPGIGIMADQDMTAGRKDGGPAVGHAGRDIPRSTGGAEPVVTAISQVLPRKASVGQPTSLVMTHHDCAPRPHRSMPRRGS